MSGAVDLDLGKASLRDHAWTMVAKGLLRFMRWLDQRSRSW